MRRFMKSKLQTFLVSLVMKHVYDSIKAVNGREGALIHLELVYRERFGIHEVVDEQDRRTDLLDHHFNKFAAGLISDLKKKRLH